MTKITFLTPKRVSGEVGGTDGRLDVSSRTSTRAFYISRDDGQAFTTVSVLSGSNNSDYVLYYKNTDATGRAFFVDNIRCGAELPSLWKLHFVTGDAAGGAELTPTNLNKISSNGAAATARGNGIVTGLTSEATVHILRTPAFSSIEENFSDSIVLGQNDAIAIQISSGSSGNAEVALRGFFETLD